jgi:hypothetical protein
MEAHYRVRRCSDQFFVADADGKNPKPLVAHAENEYNASFSAGGKWVVFTETLLQQQIGMAAWPKRFLRNHLSGPRSVATAGQGWPPLPAKGKKPWSRRFRHFFGGPP